MSRKAPTKEEKAHMERVARMGCLVCGGAATIHHVTATIHGPIPLCAGPRRSHRRIVPLCPLHHQAVHDDASNPQSVERLGHHGFWREYGIDLFETANELWKAA